MPNEHTDPSGDTEAFRAFANPTEPAAAAGGSKQQPVVIVTVAAVAAVVLIGLVGWLALG